MPMSETNIRQEGNFLSPPEILRRMIMSYFISQSIYVAAKLGIADLLANGPRSIDELATATSVHPPSLYRVLRLLAGVGVFSQASEREFTLNDLGACLRTGVSGSIRSAAILFGEEPFHACEDLLYTVKTGETAFEHIYRASHFEYLADNPTAAQTFHDGIRQLTEVVYEVLVAAYDFSATRTLVDVGGGQGLLFAAILKANRSVRGILFETPVARAGAEQLIQTEGLTDRCDIVAGDFFDAIPAGGDIYLLKSVIHNWNDERAIKILRNCRRAIPKDGILLLVERVIPEDNEPFFPKLNDIVMMVVAGGAERTEREYRTLYEAAGFTLTRVIPTSSGFSFIEGVPR
jgi:hypothetical protein